MTTKEYKLSSGRYIKHSESLLEAIADTGAHIDQNAADEANVLLDEIMDQPYGILVNLTHDFSYDFDASLNIGSSTYEKKVAILTVRPTSHIAMASVIDAQRQNFPEKKLEFFINRTEALHWLNELPTN